MFVLARALTYAMLFLSLFIVFVPMRIATWSGLVAPPRWGALQLAGMAIVGVGVGIALWCVLTFATQGRGTPLPIDPPRRLVVRGPYRFVRNPMSIGAFIALLGAAVYY